jgi:hypothetical protein
MSIESIIHSEFVSILLETMRDVLPIIIVIFGFQYLVLRQRIRNVKKVLVGLVYVILGLACFGTLAGLLLDLYLCGGHWFCYHGG